MKWRENFTTFSRGDETGPSKVGQCRFEWRGFLRARFQMFEWPKVGRSSGPKLFEWPKNSPAFPTPRPVLPGLSTTARARPSRPAQFPMDFFYRGCNVDGRHRDSLPRPLRFQMSKSAVRNSCVLFRCGEAGIPKIRTP